MSNIILPSSYKGKKNAKACVRMCVAQLAERITPKEGEEHPPNSIWCDVIAMVDLGVLMPGNLTTDLISAAYDIPEKEREPFYLTDYQGKGMSRDRFGDRLALCEVREFFQSLMTDCKKMTTGESLPERRLGVALFALQGVIDNPMYEPLVNKGHIKIVFFRT